MGGSALKVNTSRMNRDEFERLSYKCLMVVRSVCPDSECMVVPSYFSKESFGDLDILVSLEGFNQDKVAQALEAVEVFRQKNATYCCMGVRLAEEGRVFQVDFLEEPLDTYRFALAYYSFNDLGNLLGILVARHGLKLKHNGLYYYPRKGDEVLAEVVVSRDFNEVLLFLGLEPSRFSTGFESLTDLFEFVVASRFFSAELYLLENRNHRSRTRDRKRPTYQAFLQYCAEKGKQAIPPQTTIIGLEEVCRFFKSFKSKLDAVHAQKDGVKRHKKVFNGDLVASLTGLRGKPLGDFLEDLRTAQESNGLLQAVSSGDARAVEEVVKREFERLAAGQAFGVEGQTKP